jgi:hypothetical protein
MFDAAFKISLWVGIGLTLAAIVIGLLDMKPKTKKWLAGILGLFAIAAFAAAILSCPVEWQLPIAFRSPIRQPARAAQQVLGVVVDPYLFLSYGADAEKACSATLDGSPLNRLSNKYRIALICGIVDPSVDKWQDTRITISPAFTIQTSALTIQVFHSKSAATAIQHLIAVQARSIPTAAKKIIGIQWTMWYQAILLPNNVSPKQTHCLLDVRQMGGVIVDPGRTLTTISKP